MKKSYYHQLLLWSLLSLLLGSCKSEFEKIRVSTDAELVQRKALEYYEKEDYQKAATLFELVISNLRGKVEAEKVYFYYSYCHYYQGKYILASHYFKDFASKFRNSSFREEAVFMSAYSNYKLSPSFRLDQTYTLEAISGLEQFVNSYPGSTRVEECNRLIDEMRKKLERKAYAEGELYFNLRDYQAATHSFENLLRDYPETEDAQKVRYMIIRANFLLAQNSIVDKQQERFKATLDKYQKFIERYPDSDYSRELKDIYDTSTKKLNQLKDERYQIKSSRA